MKKPRHELDAPPPVRIAGTDGFRIRSNSRHGYSSGNSARCRVDVLAPVPADIHKGTVCTNRPLGASCRWLAQVCSDDQSARIAGMKRIRFRLITLVLASGIVPPILAALWFAPAIAIFTLAVALLFLLESFLWPNTGPT